MSIGDTLAEARRQSGLTVTQVSERTRTFLEKDLPMRELILRRGVHHLLDESAEPAKKAA